MALFICLLVVLIASIVLGRRWSLQQARAGNVEKAMQRLRWSSWGTGAAAFLCFTVTQGWPWKSIAVSVADEISTTVEETVRVPVKFLGITVRRRTEVETREVKETVLRDEHQLEFSPLLLCPMLLVGFTWGWAQNRIVRWSWRLGK